MILFKWFAFVDEGKSEERVLEEYRHLPDAQLAAIEPTCLTAVGLRCYRHETARRAMTDKSVRQPQKLEMIR